MSERHQGLAAISTSKCEMLIDPCCENHWLLLAGYNNLDSGYAFGYDSIAFGPMSDMISYQRDLVKHISSMRTSYAGCCLA